MEQRNASKNNPPELLEPFHEDRDERFGRRSFLNRAGQLAMQEAAALDAKFQETGKLSGPVHCIPVMLKDEVEMIGMPTAYGSLIVNLFRLVRPTAFPTKQSAPEVVTRAGSSSPFPNSSAKTTKFGRRRRGPMPAPSSSRLRICPRTFEGGAS